MFKAFSHNMHFGRGNEASICRLCMNGGCLSILRLAPPPPRTSGEFVSHSLAFQCADHVLDHDFAHVVERLSGPESFDELNFIPEEEMKTS